MQNPAGGVFEQDGHLFVRFSGGLGEVPGPAFGLIDQSGCEGSLCFAPFLVGRGSHQRRASQWVTECESAAALVDADQLRPFGRGQIVEVALAARVFQHAQITGAIESGQQQQPPRGGRKTRSPLGKQRLQAAAQRQDRR